jgi:hypothetical protein
MRDHHCIEVKEASGVILKILAFVAGCLLIGAATYLNVVAVGGWWQPQSYLLVALAIGVVAGAAVIGRANQRRTAILFAVMLLLGEVWQVMTTADRLVSTAEQRQAAARALVETREEAKRRVTHAKAAVQRVEKASLARIQQAEQAQRDASAATSADAAVRSCGGRCENMHATSVATAAAAVKQARAVAAAS